MNEQVFWKIIEKSAIENAMIKERFQWIEQELSHLTEPQIFKFDKVVHFLLKKSNTEDLFAASHVLIGEEIEALFLVFRFWLMLQGQRTFKKAINDPESLERFIAIFKKREIDWSEIIKLNHLAMNAYNTKTKLKNYSEVFPYELDDIDIKPIIIIDEAIMMDLVPALCNKMGWEMDFVKGTWKRDETSF